jgi:predicted DNA binding CopG/RHH family protein
MKKVRAVKLDKEERILLRSLEAGEWRSVPDFEREKERYRQYALAALRKDKRINIRIPERDLVLIQQRALEEGLPYQTLISSILHKYISGRFRESVIK